MGIKGRDCARLAWDDHLHSLAGKPKVGSVTATQCDTIVPVDTADPAGRNLQTEVSELVDGRNLLEVDDDSEWVVRIVVSSEDVAARAVSTAGSAGVLGRLSDGRFGSRVGRG